VRENSDDCESIFDGWAFSTLWKFSLSQKLPSAAQRVHFARIESWELGTDSLVKLLYLDKRAARAGNYSADEAAL